MIRHGEGIARAKCLITTVSDDDYSAWENPCCDKLFMWKKGEFVCAENNVRFSKKVLEENYTSSSHQLKVLFIIKDTDSLKIQLKHEFLTTTSDSPFNL